METPGKVGAFTGNSNLEDNQSGEEKQQRTEDGEQQSGRGGRKRGHQQRQQTQNSDYAACAKECGIHLFQIVLEWARPPKPIGNPAGETGCPALVRVQRVYRGDSGQAGAGTMTCM